MNLVSKGYCISREFFFVCVCFERLLENEKEEKIKTIIKWFIIFRNRYGSSDNPGMSAQ